MTSTTQTVLWLALATAVSGCGDSNDTAVDLEPSLPDAGGPLSFWYVQTTIAAPDGRTSYLQLLDEVQGRSITTDHAIELPGNARVFVQGDRVFTGSAEEPILQRWFPQRDGSLVPGERLSLANLGLSFIPYGNNFISNDKAYLFEAGGARRAIIWNPSTLTIRGEIDLRALEIPPFLAEIDPGVLRGDLLFAVVQQQDFAGDFNRGIQILVLNTVTDEIEAILEDNRCIGSLSGVELAEDGTIYVLGDNYLVRQWFADDVPPSCLLRILPGEVEFDPDFRLDFNAAAGGLPCTGLFYRGDGRFLTTCMDEALGSVDPRDAPLTFLNEPTSHWWEMRIDSVVGRKLDLDAVSPRTGPGFAIGDRDFIQLPEAAFFGRNALLEIIDGDQFVEVFDTAGLVTSFGQLEVQ